MTRACPHCGSPARQNPCWWSLKERNWSGDPPCEVYGEVEVATKRQRRRSRNWILPALAAIAALCLILYLSVK